MVHDIAFRTNTLRHKNIFVCEHVAGALSFMKRRMKIFTTNLQPTELLGHSWKIKILFHSVTEFPGRGRSNMKPMSSPSGRLHKARSQTGGHHDPCQNPDCRSRTSGMVWQTTQLLTPASDLQTSLAGDVHPKSVKLAKYYQLSFMHSIG